MLHCINGIISRFRFIHDLLAGKKIHTNKLKWTGTWSTLFSSTDERELISRAPIEMAHLCVYLREYCRMYAMCYQRQRSVCITTTLAMLCYIDSTRPYGSMRECEWVSSEITFLFLNFFWNVVQHTVHDAHWDCVHEWMKHV